MNIQDLFNKPKVNRTQTSTPSLANLYTPQAPVAPVVPVKYKLPDRGAEISDADIEAFKPLLYGEVSNRDYNKKVLEADVIFNTALNRQREYAKRGQMKSVADIVAMPNQYQAYGGQQYQEYHNPTNPISLKKKQEVDAIVEAIREKVKKGQYIDNTEGAYYYIHNPDQTIAYDNQRPLFAK